MEAPTMTVTLTDVSSSEKLIMTPIIQARKTVITRYLYEITSRTFGIAPQMGMMIAQIIRKAIITPVAVYGSIISTSIKQ
jgi:hypothetical protein